MKSNETRVTGSDAGIAEAAGERAKGYVDTGVSVCNAISGKALQIGQDVDDYVRARPWWAIGVAAGAGVLIGLLVGRCQRS